MNKKATVFSLIFTRFESIKILTSLKSGDYVRIPLPSRNRNRLCEVTANTDVSLVRIYIAKRFRAENQFNGYDFEDAPTIPAGSNIVDFTTPGLAPPDYGVIATLRFIGITNERSRVYNKNSCFPPDCGQAPCAFCCI